MFHSMLLHGNAAFNLRHVQQKNRPASKLGLYLITFVDIEIFVIARFSNFPINIDSITDPIKVAMEMAT